MKLYHGTTEENARSIAATGFISPGNKSQWDNTDFCPMAGCVYLSADVSDCAFHVLYRTFRGNYFKAPAAFGIVCADVPDERLMPDEDDVSQHLTDEDEVSKVIEALFISPFPRLASMLAAARRNPFHTSDPEEDWQNDESPYVWDWPNDCGSELPHRNFQAIARAITPRIAKIPALRDELFTMHKKRAIAGEVAVDAVYILPTFESADEFVVIKTAGKVARLGTQIKLGDAVVSPRASRRQKAVAGAAR